MRGKVSAGDDVMHAGSVLRTYESSLAVRKYNQYALKIERPRKWPTIIDSIGWIIVDLQQMVW